MAPTPSIEKQKVMIHGRPYVQVAGRIILAHSDNEILSMESDIIYEDEFIVRVKASVTTKKGSFSAHADSYKQTGKDIERQSPTEVAETSAYGRALAFAGYATEDGIPSAEEMQEAERRGDMPQPEIQEPKPQRAAFSGPGGRPQPRPERPPDPDNTANPTHPKVAEKPEKSETPWVGFSDAVRSKLNALQVAKSLQTSLLVAIEDNMVMTETFNDRDRLAELWHIIRTWSKPADAAAYLKEVQSRNQNLEASKGPVVAKRSREAQPRYQPPEKPKLEELFDEPQPESVRRVQMPDYPEG